MKFIINNLEWSVSFVISFDDASGTETLGETHYKDLEILILQNLDYQMRRRTVMHEVTHAFLFSYGLDSADYDEEFVCRFMESHAEQIIKTTDAILNSLRG